MVDDIYSKNRRDAVFLQYDDVNKNKETYRTRKVTRSAQFFNRSILLIKLFEFYSYRLHGKISFPVNR